MAYTPQTMAGVGRYIGESLKFQMAVTRTGRMKPPKLDQGQLTRIGTAMVVEQRLRWAKGINANGQKAAPLKKRYFFIKKAYTGQQSPIRDNRMTGALNKNFQLRKAVNGVIRAEPSMRMTRLASQRAEKYEHMTGFAPSDEVSLYRGVIAAFENYAANSWQPSNG